MYNEKIMEEFYNPQNFGVIKGASGVGKVTSDIGSEIIKIFISVQGDKIADVQFQTFGGVVAIACSSFATRLMMGKSISEVKKLNANHILELAGEIPENKLYIVQMVVQAMHASIEKYASKNS